MSNAHHYVPTGYVPRIDMIEPPPRHDDAIQKAVDDYRLMERKARAWDEALRISDSSGLQRSDLDFIWGLVHSAQSR